VKTLRNATAISVVAAAVVFLWAVLPGPTVALAVTLAAIITIATRTRLCVTVLLAAGALLLDFSPLPVYRYFLLSDLLLLSACALQFWIDRRVIVYVPMLFLLLCIGYLTALFAAFAASHDFSGLANWMHFAFLMLVFVPLLTTLFVRRPDLAGWLAVAIVLTVLLQSLILFAEIANGLEWRVGTRILGALGTAGLWNYVSAVVILTGIAVGGTWPTRIASGVAMAVVALAAMFLRSRMLWLTSVLGAAFMLSFYGRRRMRGLIFLALVAAAITVGYLGEWYPDAIQRRIADTLRPTETSDLVARLQVVRDLASAIEQSNGLGIGVGQSEAYLRDHHSTAAVVNVHNIVLHAAVEGGLLAAVCILLLPLSILALWRSALRSAHTPAKLLLVNWEVSTLLAVYVGAQLTPTLYEHTFYVVLAALAAAAFQTRDAVVAPSSSGTTSDLFGLRRMNAI
jgi:O-antigen ligase